MQYAPEDIEVLIIDDASSDNSREIIASFCQADSRVKALFNEKNLGVNRTLNLGLKAVQGEYFFGLAADDKLLPNFFPKMLPLLKAHPELGLCSSDYAYFYDYNPEEIKVNRLLNIKTPYLLSHPEETLKLFQKQEFWIPGHTSIVRTKYAIEYGGYQEQIHHSSDFYLFHKIALKHPVAYIPEGLSAMRILPISFTAQCLKNKKVRNTSYSNLLNLIRNDECKSLFQKSTLLRAVVQNFIPQILLRPKYWPFLFPVLKKKLKKQWRSFFKSLD